VLANCRYLSGSAEDAQDLAQDVFVKVYFALRRFRGESTFGTWVQRIKVNHCLNYLRRDRGKNFLDVEDPAVPGDRLDLERMAERRAGPRRGGEEGVEHRAGLVGDGEELPRVLLDERHADLLEERDRPGHVEAAEDLADCVPRGAAEVRRPHLAVRDVAPTAAGHARLLHSRP